MKETYEIGPGRIVTVTVQVDDAPSTALVPGERLYTAAEVGDLQASEAELVAAPLRRRVTELEHTLAESRELVEFKSRVADEVDEEAERLRGKVRELIQKVARLESRLANGTADEVDRLARQVRELSAKVRLYDEDRVSERDRADRLKGELTKSQEATSLALNDRDRLARRVAELERSLGQSIDRENRMEAELAEERRANRQSLAARDSLLEKATKRAAAATEYLADPRVAEAREGIVTSRGSILADAIMNALRVLDRA